MSSRYDFFSLSTSREPQPYLPQACRSTPIKLRTGPVRTYIGHESYYDTRLRDTATRQSHDATMQPRCAAVLGTAKKSYEVDTKTRVQGGDDRLATRSKETLGAAWAARTSVAKRQFVLVDTCISDMSCVVKWYVCWRHDLGSAVRV